MRIQQLEYLEKVAEIGSINEAAKSLFLSQPALSNAIKELENEMNICLLHRSKLGVALTEEGREFLSYARQIIDQVDLLEKRYKHSEKQASRLSISSQHYAFSVHAFVEFIQTYEDDSYQFSLRETETKNILEDVAGFRSEIGILFLNNFNRQVLEKLFEEKNLAFSSLFYAAPHIFISKDNPLAHKNKVTLEELSELPYLSFEQGNSNSFYFAEEILSTRTCKKHIKVSDRATIFNLMIGLNGYTFSSGIISRELNDDSIVAIPLDVPERIEIGWIRSRRSHLSLLGQRYLDTLKKHIRDYGFNTIEEEAYEENY
ncbi:LysR family transcriptional regulator [Enterococcus sp. BWB1-3]|uniref:LysR family transcriptional regulator n=1 Tax=unclassified Enterococcus TaxID=2608891 RepID=UPI001922347C|nr:MULTISPECIES: LysR family transcriptional regulator [unclassified Enterococcus]MBL1227796.1 LysR family transcriptional regulator [Enterococcus sp. BWB1-3]MCB5954573.1 LysR family transcriptional regulator [Enterococcus sp. CWB-B31]